MSLELELQSDLHEAFRLLYEDEDDFDADWFDDDTEADASTVVKIDQPVEKASLGSSKYSKVILVKTAQRNSAKLTRLVKQRNACKIC